MPTADVNGVTLRYEEQGGGEPVLLIHGGLFVDTFKPFFAEPALSSYRLIRYDRRALGGSTAGATPSTMRDQAADGVALLDHLGVDRAHVVGHSAGGAVALQLASQSPERVGTLSLFEPGFPEIIAGEEAMAVLARAAGLIEADPAGAVDTFFTLVMGPAWVPEWQAALPGSFEQGVADVAQLFGEEASCLLGWSWGADEAAEVTMPTMFLLGSESDATVMKTLSKGWFGPARDRCVELLPQLQVVELEGLNHRLQVQDPARVANALAEFLQQHPI